MWSERLVTTLVMTMPLFFAGLVFSGAFKSTRSQSQAMASNLIGAMLGGFVEYNALYFGYRSLYILAAVMYLAAFIASTRKPPVEKEVVEPVAASTV